MDNALQLLRLAPAAASAAPVLQLDPLTFAPPRPGPWPALAHHGQSLAREHCPHRKGVDSPRDAVGAPAADVFQPGQG